MLYEWNQIGVNEITNLYLYGTLATPSNLASDEWIRNSTADVLKIQVNTASFMEAGPGRFALGSQSKLVEIFFSTSTDLSWLEIGREYTKDEIRAELVARGADLGFYGIDIKHVLLGDFSDDYWVRSYIWNSQSFMLSDDVRFVVDAEGNRQIKNYVIVPRGADNFDFVGGNILADIGNSLLGPAVDPWGIGRQVVIEFAGSSAPPRDYSYSDYVADVEAHEIHLAMGLTYAGTLPVALEAINWELWSQGATRALIQNKAIIYGTNESESIIADLKLGDLPGWSLLKSYGELYGVAIVAGEGNDYVEGGNAADYLWGNNGEDELYGGSGNDTLWGMADADYLVGGTGDDILDGEDGVDTLIGSSGNDILKGGSDQDIYVIDGSAGTDIIDDLDGGVVKYQDHILAGSKATSPGAQQWRDDYVTYTLVSEGTTQNLVISVGANTVTVKDWTPGKFGIQLLDADEPTPVATNLVIEGDKKPIDQDPAQEGIQTATNELGNLIVDPNQAEPDREDTLYDSIDNDELNGHGGNDLLNAHRGGNDLLDGGSGDDWLRAGTGNDTLVGGIGSDRVNGQEDDDRLYAEELLSDEDVYAANGLDNGLAGRGDLLSGEDGKDFVVGARQEDLLMGGSSRDILYGGAGNDVLYGDAQYIWSTPDWGYNRVVELKDGIDTYSVNFVDLWTEVMPETGQDGDFLYGGAGDDWLIGQNGQDYQNGGLGDDVLFGGRDSDALLGGDGNDVIAGDNGAETTGQDGDDYLAGGSGNDSMSGDGGNDILYGGDDDDQLSGDNSKIDPLLHGDDHLDGGLGNDRIFGNAGNDILLGAEGDDQLTGDGIEEVLAGAYHGRDSLHGGAGFDTLFGSGGDDELYGEEDDDRLIGDANSAQLDVQSHGNDLLDGGIGNDLLWGDGGHDTLIGGEGNDNLYGDDEDLPLENHGNDRLYGENGNDNLSGFGENDTLEGGAGDDALWGGEGDDRLIGGSGFDYHSGGGGNDTYVFSLGDSAMSPAGYTEGIQDDEGSNTLEFVSGIAADDIQLTQYPGMLQLKYSSGDSLLLMGGLASGVRTVKFADGSAFTLEGLYARNSQDSADQTTTTGNANLVGSALNNSLSATGGLSTFRGGLGDDTFTGSGGGNIYLYERGDGVDHIYDTGGNTLPDGTPAPNRIRFGTGIHMQDVRLAPGTAGTLEVLISGQPSGKLVIHNFDASNAANSSAIDYFDFADGISVSYAQLLGAGFTVSGGNTSDNLLGSNLSDFLSGNGDDDTLSAGAASDTLIGGAGNDQLFGNDGADLYLYGKGHGNDIIVETNDGNTNTLRFMAGVFAEDIELAADSLQNLLLRVKSTGETLVLAHWLASGSALVQRIEFADGTLWTPEWIRQNLTMQSGTAGNDVLSALDQSTTLYGLAGNDTLNGGGGDDQLVGGTGNDIMVGGLGNDVYMIELGDAQDILTETGGQDSLVYGSSIAAEDIQVGRVGSDLVLTHANDSDKLTFKDWFRYADGRAWVEEIRLADGCVWTAEELTRKALTQVGTDDYDNLEGINEFGDTLHGGGGNDHLESYSGDDYLEGGAGYDYLYGDQGNDTLSAGPDGGYAAGSEGDDLYLYAAGDGSLNISESNGTDTLRFGPGISLDNMQFQRQGSDLYITLADGGQINVYSWLNYADGSRMVERFEFADGTQLTASELNQVLLVQQGTDSIDNMYGTSLGDTLNGASGSDYLKSYGGNDLLSGDQGHDRMYAGDGDDRLEGGEGDDQLYGEAGNDYLNGGTGDDFLVGGTGDDSYSVLGQGYDRILDSAGLDSLYFASDINPEHLIITRVDADLRIELAGRDDSVTLLEWFRGPRNSIERFIFADGSQWSVADIDGAFTSLSGNGSLSGGASDDLLYGGAGQDSLYGAAGNDLLDGSAGADILVGGSGDDTYVADGGDSIVELLGEGIDTLVWVDGTAAVLQEGLENLVLAESAGYQATGNALNNHLRGNSASNSLNGAAGADTLEGGLGDDSYYVDSTDDRVIELASQGTDTVSSSVSYALGANVENLYLSSTAAIDGMGNHLDNNLGGNDGNNRLEGLAGNDYLQGRLGVDTLLGGEGDDIYRLDDYSDVLIEEVDAGHDRIIISPVTPMERNVYGDHRDQFVMAGNIEDLRFTGYVTSAALYGNSLDNLIDARDSREYVDSRSYFYANADIYAGAGNDTLYASDASCILDGGVGDDLMIGGVGGDTYYVDSALDRVIENPSTTGWYPDKVMSMVSYGLGANLENLTLLSISNINGTGNELSNTLTGNSGNNLIDGGAGNDQLIGGGGSDTLVGGIGNDTYVVSSLSDLIIEHLDEGMDSVETSSSYTLGTHIENLTLTGSAVIDGTGNELDNLISGNSARNKLVGGSGNDTLNGLGGNDYMEGRTGDDILDGGLGNDTLLGGTGNDSYYVDSTKDVVTEYASEGIDTVHSNIAYTLGNHLENLTLTGGGTIKGTGNALDNWLTGNSAANSLSGGDGNDTLDGGAGNDTLIGGLGSDAYLLGRGHGTDTISENDSTTGNNDIARFMSGIEVEQLWFREVGKGKNTSLELSVIGTEDKFIIDKWFVGAQYRIEQFEVADGKVLLEGQVQSLVDAMASFSPPSAGQTTLPENYQAALASVIAANWQ
ncbi:calcium-binding protein [Azotobacter beijerinckii]|uniref:calcium-binding protein n=1 Tax=Azotobacter beijerinckii TaxID=170623 RepID=UPI000ACBF252|nr:calcium-binding protein [Azotobacter beijerinckii]